VSEDGVCVVAVALHVANRRTYAVIWDVMAKPRVVIADDHRLVVAGLEHLLESECDVVGTVFDGLALLDEVRRLHPEVVVQDLSMPPVNGVDLIAQIHEIDAAIRIVVLTMWEDPDVAVKALRAGASAYVLKSSPPSELLDAIRSASEKKSYVTPLMAGEMIHFLAQPSKSEAGSDELTPRQREVLRLLAEGKSMKEVASILNVRYGRSPSISTG